MKKKSVSGSHNSGHYNSGNYNSGHYNSGSHNSGHFNSGHYNSGDRNSGNCNSGHFNSGSYNSGEYNSGNYNSGNYNSGFFCTETPKPCFFDSPIDLSWEEAYQKIPQIVPPETTQWIPFSELTKSEKKIPGAEEAGGTLRSTPKALKEWFPEYWKSGKISDQQKERFKSLPNFDAKKFFEITGVDVTKESKPIAAPESVIRVQLGNGQVVEIVGKVIS